MAARVGIERRDAHQPVHARFRLHPAMRVVALDDDGRRLDAGLVARGLLDDLDVEAAPLAPAHVHAQQHARPVAAFGAAGAGMDFDIGVVAVGLARQQRFELALLALGLQRAQRREPLLLGGVVALGLAEFDQRRPVLELALELGDARRAGLPAACVRASASARRRRRSRNRGVRIWRSVPRGGASRFRRQRCLLSSPTDCLMSEISDSASARMGLSSGALM